MKHLSHNKYIFYKSIEYGTPRTYRIYRTSPIGSCFSDNVGNSELREILREYFGKSEISYTADYSNEIWGEVMQFLERNCKFIKDIELSSGLVSIYETDVVNEYLVRFELENGGRNFVFWKKESTNGFVTKKTKL